MKKVIVFILVMLWIGLAIHDRWFQYILGIDCFGESCNSMLITRLFLACFFVPAELLKPWVLVVHAIACVAFIFSDYDERMDQKKS